jgi:glyoxylase-like metal-dependent hydrolase (beta-lactamase superfamily II)
VKDIPIPEDEAVPLDDIAPGVTGLRVVFVNVFAVRGEEDGWTLIDAGVHDSAMRIRHWARRHFGDEPPRRILLTHAHFDHVGVLDTLAEECQAPVYIHHEEIDYVRGDRAYPPPDPSPYSTRQRQRTLWLCR